MSKIHSRGEVRLQCMHFTDKGCNVLMSQQSVLDKALGWARVVLCAGWSLFRGTLQISEFWNSLISELTTNVSASAPVFTVFPLLPVLFSTMDLVGFEAQRAVPCAIADAGCPGNVCGWWLNDQQCTSQESVSHAKNETLIMDFILLCQSGKPILQKLLRSWLCSLMLLEAPNDTMDRQGAHPSIQMHC